MTVTGGLGVRPRPPAAQAEARRVGGERGRREAVRNDAGNRIAKGLVTSRALERPPPGEERQRVAQAEPEEALVEVARAREGCSASVPGRFRPTPS